MAKPLLAPVRRSSSLPLAAPVALLALLLAPSARADWKVLPSVELRETYSDNARLVTSDVARGQFISDLAPSVAVTNNGPRLQLRGIASAHLYGYWGGRTEGLNTSQRQLLADARARLIEDLLFLDGFASIGQRSISAFGPQANNNNGYSDANRAEVSTWRISPYLRHKFGRAAVAELRYAHDSVKPGSFGLGESSAGTASLSLASGESFRNVGWGLQLNEQELDDSQGGRSTSQNAGASLRFRLSRTFSLNLNGGYDKYDYEAIGGGETAGRSYSTGFTWAPSARTSIEASAGKRYFGSSYSLAASHRTRRTVWTLNYRDAVTNTRSQFLLPATVDTASLLDSLFGATITDPVARRQAVDAYLRTTGLPAALANNINYFSNRFMLQKEFLAAAAYNGARTTGVLSLSASKRNALSTQQSDSVLLGTSLSSLNDNVQQVGASLAVNYRLSSRTGINFLAGRARVESLTTGIIDNQHQLSLSATHLLERKLRGAVELRRSGGNAMNQIGRTYRENAISAFLSYQL